MVPHCLQDEVKTSWHSVPDSLSPPALSPVTSCAFKAQVFNMHTFQLSSCMGICQTMPSRDSVTASFYLHMVFPVPEISSPSFSTQKILFIPQDSAVVPSLRPFPSQVRCPFPRGAPHSMTLYGDFLFTYLSAQLVCEFLKWEKQCLIYFLNAELSSVNGTQQ